MNSCQITGRLVADPEIKYIPNGTLAIADFTVAVDRPTKDKKTDFIPVKAFGKTADFMQKYFHKGMKIDLVGRIQRDSYTKKDGTKTSYTYIAASDVEFGESRYAAGNDTNPYVEQAQQRAPMGSVGDDNPFLDIPKGVDEEFPFG